MSILISQYLGAKRESEKVVSVCGTSHIYIYYRVFRLEILGWFAALHILEFMKVPQGCVECRINLHEVVFLGTPSNLVYNMNAGILRTWRQ